MLDGSRKMNVSLAGTWPRATRSVSAYFIVSSLFRFNRFWFCLYSFIQQTLNRFLSKSNVFGVELIRHNSLQLYLQKRFYISAHRSKPEFHKKLQFFLDIKIKPCAEMRHQAPKRLRIRMKTELIIIYRSRSNLFLCNNTLYFLQKHFYTSKTGETFTVFTACVILVDIHKQCLRSDQAVYFISRESSTQTQMWASLKAKSTYEKNL